MKVEVGVLHSEPESVSLPRLLLRWGKPEKGLPPPLAHTVLASQRIYKKENNNMEKAFQANGTRKQARVIVLITGKKNRLGTKMRREKEGLFILRRGIIHL